MLLAGYQTAYSQLVFAGKKEHDPFGGAVPDAKVYLAQCLHKLSVQHPGKVLYVPCVNQFIRPSIIHSFSQAIKQASKQANI